MSYRLKAKVDFAGVVAIGAIIIIVLLVLTPILVGYGIQFITKMHLREI